MRSTLLAGHGLRKEGQPYNLGICTACEATRLEYGTWRDENGDRSLGNEGHGLCACGAMSDHLTSDRARRRWHVTHKLEMTR